MNRKVCQSRLKVLVQHRYPGRTRNQGVVHGAVSTSAPHRTRGLSRTLAAGSSLRAIGRGLSTARAPARLTRDVSGRAGSPTGAAVVSRTDCTRNAATDPPGPASPPAHVRPRAGNARAPSLHETNQDVGLYCASALSPEAGDQREDEGPVAPVLPHRDAVHLAVANRDQSGAGDVQRSAAENLEWAQSRSCLSPPVTLGS